jgi:SHS2 domain-containing protein
MPDMAQAWEFFEHTADIGVRATGATLAELFVNAARAMYAALGELHKSNDRQERKIELQAESLEDLLHDWLTELLFEVEANHTLFDEMKVEVVPGRLTATVRGGKIDFDRSLTNEEIKAVTYHHLRVERLPDNAWQATVILDV